MKRLICFLLTIFLLLTMVGCTSPDNRRTVERQLRNILVNRIRFVSEETDEADRSVRFTFQDRTTNDIIYVNSSLRQTNLIGYMRRRSTNALAVYVPTVNAVRLICRQEYRDYGNYSIEVIDFADIPTVAEIIYETIKGADPIPMNREAFRDFFGLFHPPAITATSNGVVLSSVLFLWHQEEMPALEDIEEQLRLEYVNAVGRGRIEEELPDEILISYLSGTISVRIEIGDSVISDFKKSDCNYAIAFFNRTCK